MKNNVLKRIENLENGLKVERKIPFLSFVYPYNLGDGKEIQRQNEKVEDASLKARLDEISKERGEKITESDIEMIVAIKQFFSRKEVEVAA